MPIFASPHRRRPRGNALVAVLSLATVGFAAAQGCGLSDQGLFSNATGAGGSATQSSASTGRAAQSSAGAGGATQSSSAGGTATALTRLWQAPDDQLTPAGQQVTGILKEKTGAAVPDDAASFVSVTRELAAGAHEAGGQ